MLEQLHHELTVIFPQINFTTDEMLCYAYGTDASLYRLTPKMIIFVKSSAEVTTILSLANKHNTPITFRAAGTSLSGQAVTGSVLVVLDNQSWQNHEISNNGLAIKLEPGIIASHANQLLLPYRTQIGPDPASIDSCKIGGIVANNSSGMCCGIDKNTYKTMKGISFILANGSSVDTLNAESCENFRKKNSGLLEHLQNIRQEIFADNQLVEAITNKFKIKNTSGYSLNAFLDFTDPLDILAHLLVGSEGTLGFISNVTYACVVNNPHKAVSVIYTENVDDLINVALMISEVNTKLSGSLIDAMELLDITSLHSIENLPSATTYLPNLGIDTTAMLLEISANKEVLLQSKIVQLQAIIEKNKILKQVEFTTSTKTYNELWTLRKGVYPAIGARKNTLESVVIEDIAVRIDDLPAMLRVLRELFVKYDYANAAIFGHILSGNVHFVFTPSFATLCGIHQYKAFMAEMTNIIVTKFQGSLKAEHGVGRNISPFVELEWGPKLYAIMWRIKNLLDPNHILNPDVILSKNNDIHVENLKTYSEVKNEIDKCVECGFCESVCPAQNLTLTPRQRIIVYRRIMELKNQGNILYKKFIKKYAYYGIKTCATTGLCKTKCPVGIDTGKFIQDLKVDKSYLSAIVAKNYAKFLSLNRFGIKIINLVAKTCGKKHLSKASFKAHKIIPLIPIYLPTLPIANNRTFVNLPLPNKHPPSGCKNTFKWIDTSHAPLSAKITKLGLEIEDLDRKNNILNTTIPEVLYFPSCSSRLFADDAQDKSNKAEKLLTRMGYFVRYPESVNNLCCGQIFKESTAFKFKNEELVDALAKYNMPIIIDNSSCFYTYSTNLLGKNGNVMSMMEFIAANIDKLQLYQKYNSIALHIDCSTQKLRNTEIIYKILQKCAKNIVVPKNISCCGFAGTKGFTTPELNESALSMLKEQIKDCEVGVTFNQNCQIGLSYYGAKRYISLVDVLLQSCVGT